MSELRKPEPDGATFRPRCVSIDIEVGGDDRIHALGAVRPDTGPSLTHSDVLERVPRSGRSVFPVKGSAQLPLSPMIETENSQTTWP